MPDAGDVEAQRLVRILTPLIKFRACRDARKVTVDAMEVRGGCGYIEEWIEPRLVRDSHLGSIWEGTSNIVALDVMRAITREASLPALQAHWTRLIAEAELPTDLRDVLTRAAQRSASLAEAAAVKGHEATARRAASALYHVTTACSTAWEAQRRGRRERQVLARLVLQHCLLPQDPLMTELGDIPGAATLLVG